MGDRCERCDRPSATLADYDDKSHVDGCECERCTSLCWRAITGGHCELISPIKAVRLLLVELSKIRSKERDRG